MVSGRNLRNKRHSLVAQHNAESDHGLREVDIISAAEEYQS